MQHLHHPQRTLSARHTSAGKWQLLANTALVAAAFAFVGAVTLGLFP